MILLWGVRDDKPLIRAEHALQQLGARFMVLDQERVLDTWIELSVGSTIEAKLGLGHEEIDLSSITAVYVRTHNLQSINRFAQDVDSEDAWRHVFEIEDALFSWLELTPALVVNRYSAMAPNFSKPYQGRLIQSYGFEVPDTVITTDPDTVAAFQRKYKDVIFKSLGGMTSMATRLTPENMKHLESVTWCPTMFQEYIPGDDYRVHVVGDEIHCCRIISDSDDYRYALRLGKAMMVRRFYLPPDIAEKCITMTKDMGLILSGIDLRRTPEGRWVCFEVNPSPIFSYYQENTGLPIAESLARLLANAEIPSRRRYSSNNWESVGMV